MLGSTIIYEPDCIKLMALEAVDNIEDIISIDLDRLSLTKLSPLLPDRSIRLLDEEPVIYDPENDVTLLEINPKGLEYILKLSAEGVFAEYAADFTKLARLTKHHGFEDMYEMLSI